MLREGRLKGSFDELFKNVNSSLKSDKHLWREDIAGSRCYAMALERIKVISDSELRDILSGLDQIEKEIQEGTFHFDENLEDIHMCVEFRLSELAPGAGAKLHTGRSRNEQIALDERMHQKKVIGEIQQLLRTFIGTLVRVAESHQDTIMPAYTHLQPAQATTLAHHLLAYAAMLQRDHERIQDCAKRTDVMPLGSGACTGSGFDIERHFLAKNLGFANISANSLDAVSDRDYLLEFLSASSIVMVHLSRMCEDFIFWASAEGGFLELDDSVSSTSSMMPQKRNPDALELVRGKTGRVFGNCMALLTTMKALPLSYNKDMQEDKDPWFDTVETVFNCLKLLNKVVEVARFNKDAMYQATVRVQSYLCATDVADYLVEKGLPFREAHKIVGQLVGHASRKKITLDKLALAELRTFSALFEADVYEWLKPQASLKRRNLPGGTGPASVAQQILNAKNWLAHKE